MMRELFLRDLSLWACLWQSTVFLTLGLVGGWLLRRRPARAYEAILCAMMAAALVPFLTALVKHYDLGAFAGESEVSAYLPPHAPALVASEAADTIPGMDGPAPIASPGSGPSPAPTANLSWQAILLSAWLAATLLLLARLAATFLYGARLVRCAQSPGCEEIQQAAEGTASRLRVAHGLQVRASARVRGPVVWCWTRPPILLVPRVLGRPDIDWTGVVAHELAHWRRWDHATGLVAELTASLLPWNPLMWLSRRFLIRLGEQACDDWVVASGQSSEDYAEALLRFRPQKQMAFWPAVVSSRTGLAHRVRRILDDACGNPRAGVRWALALSIIALGIGIGVAFAQTRPVPPEAPAKQEEKPTKSLHEAAASGDIEQVKSLISAGTNVNAKDEKGRTPLHRAAYTGSAEVARFLLEHGAGVNAEDNLRRTPLEHAVAASRTKVVELLLDKGANVNARNKDGETPLHIAAASANKDIVEALVDKGADLTLRDNEGSTPVYSAMLSPTPDRKDVVRLLVAKSREPLTIHLAAYLGDLEKVRSFVQEGTNVNEKGVCSATPLHLAAAGSQKEVVEFLTAQSADLNANDADRMTPLDAAVFYSGDKEIIELLVAKGAHGNTDGEMSVLDMWFLRCYISATGSADLDASDENRIAQQVRSLWNSDVTQLLLANGAKMRSGWLLTGLAQMGMSDIVESLVAQGTDVNTINPRDGSTLLHGAAGSGQTKLTELLISKGANVNAKDGKGQTPLHAAVLAGRKDIVELLIAQGANVNTRADTWDTTPLIAALNRGQEDMAKLLIAKGADVSARGRGDYTPLHCAAMNRARMTGSTEIMELLLAKGADIEARQEHGATPLACATYDGNTQTTKFLIEHGANIEAKLNDGETTPLLRAVSQEHVETARLLLDKGANIHARWRGLSAIHVAMLGDWLSNKKPDPEMVKLLTEKGMKCLPIHLAAFLGDLEKVKDCLNDATRIDEPDAAGYTPLHCAVGGNHMVIVKLLLSKGAKVNAKTRNGWTPLGFTWTTDMAAFLIANGADVRIADERGQTVLHWAVNRDNHRGDKALIELLLKHGADINAKAASTSVGWAGWTPLHVACANGAQDIVELFLARGADVNAKTDKGETPMAVAQSNGQGRIVDLLRKHGAKE